jgi:hypothetical protein
MTETRVEYVIQGLPLPPDIDRCRAYLVWVPAKGERIPGAAELRAMFKRKYGVEPEYVHEGVGTIYVGPAPESAT